MKTIMRTCFVNYDKIFDFNNNIKIICKNVNELICIMLLNEIIYNLMHNEYLLMSEKVVNKNVYIQFIINKSIINFFYAKYILMLKKSIIILFNVIKLNFMFCRLKNKFKNFNNNNFYLNKTLNLMSFFVVDENFMIKK